MDVNKEKMKIDKIVNKIRAKIAKYGCYENAGQSELRKYKDTLSFEDYSARCELINYMNVKIDSL